MRTFQFTDGKSNKFWSIDLRGLGYTVRFGKLGSPGRTQTKYFPTVEKARKAYEKLVAEKVAQGYLETTSEPTPTPSPEQVALERALAANPDDLAGHSAYADYLMEQGDPRGEFIQIQLALEDESRSPVERKKLREREAQLLAQHAKTWLGDAGRFLVGNWSGDGKPYHYRFVRGWLDLVRVLPEPDALIAVLARSPEASLLRRLEVVYDMEYHPFDFEQYTSGPNAVLVEGEKPNEMYEGAEILPPLIDSPYLSNLRVLRLGFSDGGQPIRHSTMVQPFGTCRAEQVIQLLTNCPQIEELYLNCEVDAAILFASPALGNLRVFQYYYGTNYSHPRRRQVAYPFEILAKNKSLEHITTLLFHPGRDAVIEADQLEALLQAKNLPNLTRLQIHMTSYGDEGARRIVNSGILKKLKTLDIAYGNMTDEGARLLGACPDFKHLEVLDVSRNALTRAGISALKGAGVRVLADDQHDLDDQDYLYEVDFE